MHHDAFLHKDGLKTERSKNREIIGISEKDQDVENICPTTNNKKKKKWGRIAPIFTSCAGAKLQAQKSKFSPAKPSKRHLTLGEVMKSFIEDEIRVVSCVSYWCSALKCCVNIFYSSMLTTTIASNPNFAMVYAFRMCCRKQLLT